MRFVAISVLTIVASLSGCGVVYIKKKNCSPPLAYISDSFITYRLVGRGLSKWRSYDELQVSEAGDWLLELSGDWFARRVISYANNKKKEVELERHPPGTVLSLTGEGITRKPYGLMEVSSERTYLKGYIGEKTVWFPAILLYSLNKSGYKLNIVSNRQIALDKYYRVGWRCINK